MLKSHYQLVPKIITSKMVLGYFWGFKRALKNSKVKHLRTYLIVLPLYKKIGTIVFVL